MARQPATTAALDIGSLIVSAARGQQVILDADLARIYGVRTKRLNEQVKRNAKRFPPDFMFRLTREEAEECHRTRSGSTTVTAWSDRSQIATGSQKHHLPHPPACPARPAQEPPRLPLASPRAHPG
jgi:hypothetical protein